jgi:hypothetical protein
MGKIAKSPVFQIAAITALAFTGFGLAGMGPLSGLQSFFHLGVSSSGSMIAGGIGGSSTGLFGAGIVTKANAGLFLSGLGAVSHLAQAQAEVRDAGTLAQMEAARRRLANIQNLQLEAKTIRTANALRSAAVAQAAAQGQDVSTSRSFLAFLEDQEKEKQTTIGSIRVSNEVGAVTSNIRLRALSSKADAAAISGVLGAGRSLLKAVV